MRLVREQCWRACSYYSVSLQHKVRGYLFVEMFIVSFVENDRVSRANARDKFFFFFNDPATTEIYPLPPHDALPISVAEPPLQTLPGPHIRDVGADRARVEKDVPIDFPHVDAARAPPRSDADGRVQIFRQPEIMGQVVDRKSTRLNSSHSQISYAVFC